jgi:thioredoxin-dependent peroxiredoxin
MKMETIEQERTGVLKMEGRPLTLTGHDVKEGDKAPDFSAVNTSLETVRMSDYQGKVIVISSFPSIDTPTCKRQAIRFSEEADKFGDDVVVLAISMDLPFALKRWQEQHGSTKMIMLSDHRESEFAHKYGMLIKELKLIARGITIVDKQGVIRHRHIVSELASEPNYKPALEIITNILKEKD